MSKIEKIVFELKRVHKFELADKLVVAFKKLCADFDADEEYREMAVNAYKRLTKYLTEEEAFLSTYMDRQEDGWLLKGHMVDDMFKDIYFYFLKADTFNYGIGTWKADKRIRVMTLPCLLEKNDLRYVATRLNRGSFIHEYIHYLDSLRYKGKDRKKDKSVDKYHKKGDEAYYNDTTEFNAYFQEGAENLLLTVKNICREMRKYPKLGDSSLKLFPKSTDEFLKKSVYLYFSRAFIDNLNPIYKKKFLKRFYQLYEEVQSLLEEAIYFIHPH